MRRLTLASLTILASAGLLASCATTGTPTPRSADAQAELSRWLNGRVAGRAMAGAPEPYDHLPFFYSDLFDLGYEAVGELDSDLTVVEDWKEPFREGVVYYLEGGRVRGVLLWNTWGKVDAARELIAAREPFRPEDLKGRITNG